jgi:hypothetical protein
MERTMLGSIETGKYAGDVGTLATITAVLKRAGVEFIDENGGPGGCGYESIIRGKVKDYTSEGRRVKNEPNLLEIASSDSVLSPRRQLLKRIYR